MKSNQWRYLNTFQVYIQIISWRRFLYKNIELAGYNAARGDFDAEFENGMELFLNDIEVNERMYEIVNDGENKRQAYKNLSDEREENKELIAQLSVAMLHVYKRKLKARTKRKR